MALSTTENGVGRSPIVVTGTTTSSTAIVASGRYQINRLHWLNATAQGMKLALQDGTGHELWEFYCDNDGESLSVSFDPPLRAVDGIYSDDMDSGTLYIYYN